MKMDWTLGLDRTIPMLAALLLAAPTAPQGRADDAPEASAAERLRQAGAARAAWDRSFPGFAADVTITLDDAVPVRGRLRVAADGAVELDAPDGPARAWALDQIRSEVQHRLARDRDATPEAEYDADDAPGTHPLGRRIVLVGDRLKSAFRIQGDEILEVDRTMGDRRFTIQVLATTRNAEGRSLPAVFTVTYRDAATGALDRVETFAVTWARVGEYDLPAVRTQVVSADGGPSVRRLELTGHAPGTEASASR